VRFLRRRDRRRVIHFTDIDAADFRSPPGGPDRAAMMARIHGRLPDGAWIEGVEVFRRLYSAIGFGTLVSLTRLPGVTHVLDWAYAVFARNRRRLSGRCTADTCAPQRS
jgi:predicted DCC family thiol-disulfide oxidoreductase YuxK